MWRQHVATLDGHRDDTIGIDLRRDTQGRGFWIEEDTCLKQLGVVATREAFALHDRHQSQLYIIIIQRIR